jgi:predicted metal-dependent peptidase
MKKYSECIHVEGGYGTDFRPAFEKVEELRKRGDFENLKGLIYFTDGYGTFPEKPTDYDTAFVFIEDSDYEDDKVPDWALKLYM